jgi:hypothetical protein
MVKKCIELTLGGTVIKHMYDPCPDTSFLGEWTDDIGPGVIVRQYGEFYEKIPCEMERDSDGRFLCKGTPDIPSRGSECRGFRPYAGGESVGTKSYYRYGMEDWKRMESLNNGDWFFIGIKAQTTVHMSNGMSDVVESDGLWGIESDSSRDHITEVTDDELDSVRRQLRNLGFKDSDIDVAFKNITIKEED